jgi:hypothetical protein
MSKRCDHYRGDRSTHMWYMYMEPGDTHPWRMRSWTKVRFPTLTFRDGMEVFGCYHLGHSEIEINYRINRINEILTIFHEMVHWCLHASSGGWVLNNVHYWFDRLSWEIRHRTGINNEW